METFAQPWMRLAVCLLTTALALETSADEQSELPDAKPVPAVCVLPLPHDQASFTWNGQELTRYHFGPSVQRPFWYPIRLPDSRSLTRMGHPHAPDDHRHHDSVWVAHAKVDDMSFWEHDNGQRIVCTRVLEYGDGDDAAWMLTENQWKAGDRIVLRELRRCEVRPIADDQWLMIIDIELRLPQGAADGRSVTLHPSSFGLVGVRMAKTIGVHDGGGRILNASGQINEKQVFGQRTRWVDYAGPISPDQAGGITLMDHPSNPGFPAAYHVREDGWMGVRTTGEKSVTIEHNQPQRFRYGLWVHAGVPNASTADRVWKQFTEFSNPSRSTASKR